MTDKLLLVSGVVTLSLNHTSYLGEIPLWLTGAILGLDVLILIGILLVRFTVGAVTVRPRMIGKVATVLQMAVVVWVLLKWDHGRGGEWLDVLTLGAAICTGASGLLYVLDGVRQLSAHPASAAIKK